MHATPFFHADAQFAVSMLLQSGGAFVLAPRFSASRFWADAARSGATSFLYVATMLAILLKGADPPPGHAVRCAVGGGAQKPVWERFEARFGVPVLEVFGMTECIGLSCNDFGGQRLGSTGRPFEGYEVAILDALDRPLPAGAKGELAIRGTEPFALMSGYLGNPQATLNRLRNQWFHTGDQASLDADGFLYFHGRLEDTIRRGGENISADELEAIVDSHAAVLYCAAVGVPTELGDEEVLLYVQPRPGTRADPADIAAHVAARAAPFMVPRHIRLVQALPPTPTEKVVKAGLPRAVDAGTWTRPEAPGGA